MPAALLLLAVFVSTAAIVGGQRPAGVQREPASRKTESRKPPDPDLQDLIDGARAAPPELATHVLLRVAASNKLRDLRLRPELLPKVFGVLESSNHPALSIYPRTERLLPEGK